MAAFDALLVAASTPAGIATVALAATTMLLLRRGSRRCRHTD